MSSRTSAERRILRAETDRGRARGRRASSSEVRDAGSCMALDAVQRAGVPLFAATPCVESWLDP